MIYYLDEEYRVHLSQDESGGLTVWEDVNEIFHGKAQAFIEGYRVVPEGATWVRFDGAVFVGLMISPAIDYAVMEAAQAGYGIKSETGSAVLKPSMQVIRMLWHRARNPFGM